MIQDWTVPEGFTGPPGALMVGLWGASGRTGRRRTRGSTPTVGGGTADSAMCWCARGAPRPVGCKKERRETVRYAERDESRTIIRAATGDRRLFPAVLPPEAEREAARREEHAAGATRESMDALLVPPCPALPRLTPDDSDYAQG